MKKMIFGCIAAFAMMIVTTNGVASAALVIHGVVDGDLPGGNPKGILLIATADVADISEYGIGSANNGGGTDGQELALSGSVLSGEKIFIGGNSDSTDFFTNNYIDVTVFDTGGSFVASINGDDAVELFLDGLVVDTYGDPDTNGDGETWDYTDGYAVRIAGGPGAFDQANYTSAFRGLDGLDAPTHVSTIAAVYGLTAVPEPSSILALSVFSCAALVRRRKN